jgi:hypothetical protein
MVLHTLRYYGIDGKTTRWIQNWLEDRQQTVVLDGVSSEAVRKPVSLKKIYYFHISQPIVKKLFFSLVNLTVLGT